MAPEQEKQSPQVSGAGMDSATFSRCAGCRHAAEVDVSAGTLLCRKHDMRINAEADEIPDDCREYVPAARIQNT